MSTHTHSHFENIFQNTSWRLGFSLSLTLAFVVIEVIAGLLGNSLALLTDAAHNLTDVLALGLSWYAMRKALQPANARKTFGYHRAGILVAMVNSATLALISLGIFYEAWQRFLRPPALAHDFRVAHLVAAGLPRPRTVAIDLVRGLGG